MDAISYSYADKAQKRIKRFIENPDSNSGVLTQPKVIEAGETVTIKSGRQAILADTIVDGDLVIEAGGDVFVPAGAGFGDLESQISLKADTSYVDSKYSGFKNYIINGNFDIWQRGASQTSAGYGSDDRWSNENLGSTKTHSLVACGDNERVLFNAAYFSRTVVTSIIGINNGVTKFQNIEDVTKLAGKTVTLSFWARADSEKSIAVYLLQIFGTGGSPSSMVKDIGTQLVTLSTYWQKKVITINIPNIVGKTIGTNGRHTSFTQVAFGLESGSVPNSTYFNSLVLGQQSGTFDIAQVQLEEGSVATPFENRPIGLELSLCQRYYIRGIRLGLFNNAPEIRTMGASATFNTPMRITPTMGLVGGVAVTYQNTTLHGTEYYSTVNAGSWNQGEHYASAEL